MVKVYEKNLTYKGHECFIRRPHITYFISFKNESSTLFDALYAFEVLFIYSNVLIASYCLENYDTLNLVTAPFFITLIGIFNLLILVNEVPSIVNSMKTSLEAGESDKLKMKATYFFIFLAMLADAIFNILNITKYFNS